MISNCYWRYHALLLPDREFSLDLTRKTFFWPSFHCARRCCPGCREKKRHQWTIKLTYHPPGRYGIGSGKTIYGDSQSLSWLHWAVHWRELMPGTVDMAVIHGLGQPLGPIEELTLVVMLNGCAVKLPSKHLWYIHRLMILSKLIK